MMATFLLGGADQKLRDRSMDTDESFGVLSSYTNELVVSVIEALVRTGYLEKTDGMYPLLGITGKGKFSTRREHMMQSEEVELQSYVALKAKNSIFKKSNKAQKSKKIPSENTRNRASKK